MVELIPREVLFGNPEKSSPSLSRDGKRLAYLAPLDGVLNVWVTDVGSDNAKAVTKSTDRPVRSYTWTHDGRFLLYLNDKNGNEQNHCYLVNVETGEERDLTPFEGVSARIITGSPNHPGKFLLGINRDDPRLHDAYEFDLATGESKLAAKNPGFGVVFGDWIVDLDLQPRAGMRQRPDGGIDVLARDNEGEDWKTVYVANPEDYLNFRSVGFSGDGKSLLFISPKGFDTAKLIQLDLATGEEIVLAGDDEYDVSSVRRHPTTRNLQILAIYREKLNLEALDPEVAPDLERLRAFDPSASFNIMGGDNADETWLVGFPHDDAPTVYCSYDRESGEITKLFEDRPELRNYTLAKSEPFKFQARDGLTIHGYLTFPSDVEKKNLPTVLLVHGGPWGRDTFPSGNMGVQWFANRGYLCVQINFRGSTGYGSKFVNAADREWAGAMHDDLIDGIDHLVDKGVVDKSRVAIYGGSYGGYAALVGATFTPDYFTCAVDLVGPSNLITLLENIPPYWKPWESVWHTRVGHPVKDKDFLWSRSPLSRVDQIKIPMLISQGANDPRVTKVEAEQIVAAMKEKGIPHKYMLFEDEGHGFAKPENAMKFNAEAEKFLAEHLGGRFEP